MTWEPDKNCRLDVEKQRQKSRQASYAGLRGNLGVPKTCLIEFFHERTGILEQADTKTGKRRNKALWAAAAVIAIVTAGAVGGKAFYKAKVNELIAQSGATAASVDVDFQGRVHIRDLTLPIQEDETLRIAAIDGRPKLPFFDGALELSNISFDIAKTKVVVPSARIDNGEIKSSGQQVEGAKTLSQRLERLSARSVSMPELTLTQPAMAGGEQKIVYSNTTFSDIVDGRIARYSIEKTNMDFSMKSPDADGAGQATQMKMSTGEIKGQDVDVPYIARLYTERAGPDDKQAKQVYGPMSAVNVSIFDQKARISYDELSSTGFSAKMPTEPLVETLASLTEVKDPSALEPAERKAFFSKALSIFDMMGTSDIRMKGLKAHDVDKASGSEGKDSDFVIENMDMKIDGYKIDFGINGLSVLNGGDKVVVGEIAINDFDWSSTAEGIREFAGLGDQEIATFEYKRLMPAFGRMRFGGLDFDTSAPESSEDAEAGAPERIKFTLGKFESVMLKPINGIPTDVETTLEDLTIPFAENSEEFAMARSLGLKSFTSSYALSTFWDEPKNDLVIRKMYFSGKDMGSIEMSGLLSGVTRQFFSLDATNAQAALLGLTARELKLTVKDEGAMDLMMKAYALENNVSEAEARATLSLGTTVILQQVAEERPKLKSVVDALAAFVSKPGTLTVTAKSNAPNGLGVFDLMAASQDPMLLLDKVDIQAAAQ